jgi:hypothetical protein
MLIQKSIFRSYISWTVLTTGLLIKPYYHEISQKLTAVALKNFYMVFLGTAYVKVLTHKRHLASSITLF